MSLKSVRSVACAIPQTRIIGPWWLAADRYSITAATAPNRSDSLNGLLQQELTTRLGLATHVEDRDCAIYVLKAKTPPVNLERTNARGASIQVHDAVCALRTPVSPTWPTSSRTLSASRLWTMPGSPVPSISSCPGVTTWSEPWPSRCKAASAFNSPRTDAVCPR